MVAIATIFYVFIGNSTLLLAQTLIHSVSIIFLVTLRHNQPKDKIEKHRASYSNNRRNEPYQAQSAHIPIEIFGNTGTYTANLAIS